MEEKAREIAIAVDQWIQEVDEADLEPDAILVSFQAFCQEFDIPEELGKRAIARALGE
jgi:hypothetical protein